MADEYVAIILLGLGFIYFMIKLALEMDEEHFALKMFLLWMSIIALLPVIQIGIEIAESAAMSADVQSMLEIVFYMAGFVMIISSFYFGLYVFRTVLAWFGDSVKLKQPKERRRIDKL